MLWLALIILLALIIQDFIGWMILRYNFKDHHKPIAISDLPCVSVLVPARNEEEVIGPCLLALEQLEYPQEKITLLVADDHSTDQTGTMLSSWVSKRNNRKKVEIPAPSPKNQHLNGKARALAAMIPHAEGELYLFTDADCQVNPCWAKEMVASFRPEMGLLTGITKVRAHGSKSFWGVFQGLDWWLTLGMLKVTSDLGSHITAVGNNMLVSKAAYTKVGGFERLPFSVTEDFELGKAVARVGYEPAHQVSPKSLVTTKAESSLGKLLQQRKRWMLGAMGLPLYWKVLLFFQVAVFPALVVLVDHLLWWGVGLWAIKIFVQGKFIRFFAKKSGTVLSWFSLLFFEVYYAVISWSTIVYYFWPSKIHWKDRKY